jgi:hypothetical protein
MMGIATLNPSYAGWERPRLRVTPMMRTVLQAASFMQSFNFGYFRCCAA